MDSLKCQLHTHTQSDPIDSITYNEKTLITQASKQKYDVVAITCHRKIIFTKRLEKYAKTKGILLIPGIEFEIQKKHLVCLNAHKDIEEVDSYETLKQYKKNHPNSLIIAPHPFFPGPSIKNNLIKHIDLIDAIEISWAYTKTVNFNKKAVKIAQRYKKPLIATSDCHLPNQLNNENYCIIKSSKNIDSIISAIRENKIKNIHAPSKINKIISFFLLTTFAKVQNMLISKRKK